MTIQILEDQTFLAALARARSCVERPYKAMYSSWFGGLVLRPELMLVPMDDHMVHRGDAVFETFKAVAGNIYNLDAHLDRLEASASLIGLAMPATRYDITDLVISTLRVTECKDAIVRVFISRGPGSLSCRPADAVGPQLYIVVADPPVPPEQRFPNGVSLVLSRYPAKDAPFATAKSCNYLINALMDQEADDSKADFSLAVDRNGFIAECATESLGIVSADRRLLFPSLEGILRGTTMVRVAELARELVKDGTLSAIAYEDIPVATLESAQEILICATSLNVLATSNFNGKPISGGPVAGLLNKLLVRDILENRALQTPVFSENAAPV